MQPSRLLRLSRSFVEARALQLATSKGLFDFLAESPGARFGHALQHSLPGCSAGVRATDQGCTLPPLQAGGRSWQDVGQHMGFVAADGFRGALDGVYEGRSRRGGGGAAG